MVSGHDSVGARLPSSAHVGGGRDGAAQDHGFKWAGNMAVDVNRLRADATGRLMMSGAEDGGRRLPGAGGDEGMAVEVDLQGRLVMAAHDSAGRQLPTQSPGPAGMAVEMPPPAGTTSDETGPPTATRDRARTFDTERGDAGRREPQATLQATHRAELGGCDRSREMWEHGNWDAMHTAVSYVSRMFYICASWARIVYRVLRIFAFSILLCGCVGARVRVSCLSLTSPSLL